MPEVGWIDLDIRPADQLALDLDDQRLLPRHKRRSLQQPGEELARHVAAHAHPLRAEQRRLEGQRRVAGLAQPLDPGTQLLEAIDEINE